MNQQLSKQMLSNAQWSQKAGPQLPMNQLTSMLLLTEASMILVIFIIISNQH